MLGALDEPLERHEPLADQLRAPAEADVVVVDAHDDDRVRVGRRERHLGANLRAPLFLTQAFAAQAPEAGTDAEGWPVARALVVNMADQRVWKPTPAFMTYSLAKQGLWALTRTAAQALAPAIRVNAIGPGPTLRGDRQTQEHFDAQRRGTILERGASPAEICAALRYLIAADAVTGQMIAVDAGQHLGWRTPDVIGKE